MANTGFIAQSVIENVSLQNGTAFVAQSVVEMIAGVGVGCNNPPPGAIYAGYSHFLSAGGGLAPYTFVITGGALPLGLSLNAATGEVFGNPVVAGTFNWTATVTDSQNMVSRCTCQIVITGSPAATANAGGVPFSVLSRGGCSGYNEYDACLLKELSRWRHIEFPDLCVIPKEYRNLLPWPEDGERGATPPQAVPFLKTHGIVTPTTMSGDNVVVRWRVPVGYDGLLTGFYFGYSGSGFVQGSGDIVTRLRINQRYVKDLGNSPFLLGSPTLPIPLTEGQILLSGMTVDSIVSVPNLSGNIVVGASTIYAGQIGFLWPRG